MESSPTPIIKQCAKTKKLTKCQYSIFFKKKLYFVKN